VVGGIDRGEFSEETGVCYVSEDVVQVSERFWVSTKVRCSFLA
jgi:hypothetical protein